VVGPRGLEPLAESPDQGPSLQGRGERPEQRSVARDASSDDIGPPIAFELPIRLVPIRLASLAQGTIRLGGILR